MDICCTAPRPIPRAGFAAPPHNTPRHPLSRPPTDAGGFRLNDSAPIEFLHSAPDGAPPEQPPKPPVRRRASVAVTDVSDTAFNESSRGSSSRDFGKKRMSIADVTAELLRRKRESTSASQVGCVAGQSCCTAPRPIPRAGFAAPPHNTPRHLLSRPPTDAGSFRLNDSAPIEFLHSAPDGAPPEQPPKPPVRRRASVAVTDVSDTAFNESSRGSSSRDFGKKRMSIADVTAELLRRKRESTSASQVGCVAGQSCCTAPRPIPRAGFAAPPHNTPRHLLSRPPTDAGSFRLNDSAPIEFLHSAPDGAPPEQPPKPPVRRRASVAVTDVSDTAFNESSRGSSSRDFGKKRMSIAGVTAELLRRKRESTSASDDGAPGTPTSQDEREFFVRNRLN
ncbi:hypothetical protein DIPPA_00641 [Diplonema papillatum]|nr:hypothetical protein DIPPA_00641 [Diplonema papillatum]